MLSTITNYFMFFIICSFLGWTMEVLCTLFTKHRFINRGFLIGPICPIYGWGCLAIIILLSRYQNNFLVLFVMTIFLCSILEYLTSYFMEKIFKTRWWDYSTKKFNLNGRICLETMVPFGILGCIVVYLLNPIITKFLSLFTPFILNIVALIIFLVFIVDNIISFKVIFNFRSTISNVEKDATEEITKKVRDIFSKRGILKRRLIKAFPTLKSNREHLIELESKIREEIKKIDTKIKNKYKTK